MDPDDQIEALIAAQRRELVAATSAAADLDLAFRLQLDEAIAASLSHQPPSSSAASSSAAAGATQTLDLDPRSSSDHIPLKAIDITDDDRFPRDAIQNPGDDRPFRLYFKATEGQDIVRGEWVQLAGIGAALCDPDDKMVLSVQKALAAAGREVMELTALIDGLNAAIEYGIKRLHVFTDFRTLYNHITGKWVVKQNKVGNLVNRVASLREEMDQCHMSLLPRYHIKYAFKLAKDAMVFQITRTLQLNCNKNLDCSKNSKETCKICLEDTDSSCMFAVDGCLHRYCFSCMKQHIEVKLLHGMLPSCPHDDCDTRLNVESSRKFLSAELLNIMVQRIKEASIPVTDKVYCPFPKCSALMSLSEARYPQQNSSKQSGLRLCIKCSGSFCIKCKVPWHSRMSCSDYKRLNPHHRTEEAKLQSLARQNLWRQCVKCNHMIELVEGCFHMTCRCGYEFCYTCGAEWRDKKATCSCPLWDESYIWDGDSDEEYSEDSYDYEDYDDDDDDIHYNYEGGFYFMN